MINEILGEARKKVFVVEVFRSRIFLGFLLSFSMRYLLFLQCFKYCTISGSSNISGTAMSSIGIVIELLWMLSSSPSGFLQLFGILEWPAFAVDE